MYFLSVYRGFFLRTFSFRQQTPLAGPFLIPQTLSDTTSATVSPGNGTCQSRSLWTGGTRKRSMRSKPDSIQGLRRRRAAPSSRSLVPVLTNDVHYPPAYHLSRTQAL